MNYGRSDVGRLMAQKQTPVRSEEDDGVGSADFALFYEAELAGQVRGATLILGSRSAAQDVVHDAFVEVFKRWGTITDPGPYLQRAVVNRGRDMMRRDRVALRRRHLLRTENSPEPDTPLFDALSELPFNHRAAIVLRFYLLLSEAEIAGHLGCAPGSVGPWIRRGLDRLAHTLQLPTEDQ